MISCSAKRYFLAFPKQLCVCIEPVTFVCECILQIALWVWMCYFWWCYFLWHSVGITNPTDWQYLSPLDICDTALCTVPAAMPCGAAFFVTQERERLQRGLAGMDWHVTSLQPHSTGDPLRAGQVAERPTLQDGSAQHSNKHSCWVAWDLGSLTLSGIGLAKNNDHLIIGKGQWAVSFSAFLSGRWICRLHSKMKINVQYLTRWFLKHKGIIYVWNIFLGFFTRKHIIASWI